MTRNPLHSSILCDENYINPQACKQAESWTLWGFFRTKAQGTNRETIVSSIRQNARFFAESIQNQWLEPLELQFLRLVGGGLQRGETGQNILNCSSQHNRNDSS